MASAPPVLSVLRHALARPLSAAAVRVEVLRAHVAREAPGLSTRTAEIAGDLAEAGRLLDLLVTLAALDEEAPQPVRLDGLLPEGGGDGAVVVQARPAAAADAVRRVMAFGRARGGSPRASVPRAAGAARILVSRLGPVPEGPVERLLLLPPAERGAEELFLARAALAADGGSLGLSAGSDGLEATLSWPHAGGRR